MANRTIQFFGQGYAPTGTEPIVITATLNGNAVYNGTIPTLYNTTVGRLPTDQTVLFTCELPVDFAGTLPMSITLDSPVGVDAYFEQIMSNYMPVTNTIYTESELGVLTNPASTRTELIAIYTAKAVPPLSAAEIAILETGTQAEYDAVLESNNLTVSVSSGSGTFLSVSGGGDPRTNVVINGVAQTRGDTPVGGWGWEIQFPAEGSGLFECDLNVAAGLE
jgi:hypothetical protein